MTEKELQEILEKHRQWSNNEGGERAYLSCADLRGAYLGYAYLGYADLKGACLPWRSEPERSEPVNKKKKGETK